MLWGMSRLRGSNGEPEGLRMRADVGASRPGASLTDGVTGRVFRPSVHRLLGWLSAAIAALLFVPPVASAAFVLTGQTGQGLSVGVRLTSNLSTVTRFSIGWRATCSSGGSLSETTLVSKPIPVQPFPNFHRTGTYAYSTGNSANGQTVRVLTSVELHGQLMRNGRASGRWAAQARILDANGNQIDSCRTGVVGWRAAF